MRVGYFGWVEQYFGRMEVVVGTDRWRWVGMDGGEWEWVHCLIMPILICIWISCLDFHSFITFYLWLPVTYLRFQYLSLRFTYDYRLLTYDFNTCHYVLLMIIGYLLMVSIPVITFYYDYRLLTYDFNTCHYVLLMITGYLRMISIPVTFHQSFLFETFCIRSF